LVLCYETLEHFREDPMFFMIEASRVLRPNGRLILTTPNASSLKAAVNILAQYSPYLYSVYCRGRSWPGMAHIKEYAVRELQTLFQKAGFVVDSHQTFSPYKDDVDGRVPGTKDALLKLGLQEPLSGSTHFIVGRKTNLPTCRAYQPLYQADEAWTGWPESSKS
jgi:SAM-dependent methyltransferase